MIVVANRGGLVSRVSVADWLGSGIEHQNLVR